MLKLKSRNVYVMSTQDFSANICQSKQTSTETKRKRTVSTTAIAIDTAADTATEIETASTSATSYGSRDASTSITMDRDENKSDRITATTNLKVLKHFKQKLGIAKLTENKEYGKLKMQSRGYLEQKHKYDASWDLLERLETDKLRCENSIKMAEKYRRTSDVLAKFGYGEDGSTNTATTTATSTVTTNPTATTTAHSRESDEKEDDMVARSSFEKLENLTDDLRHEFYKLSMNNTNNDISMTNSIAPSGETTITTTGTNPSASATTTATTTTTTTSAPKVTTNTKQSKARLSGSPCITKFAELSSQTDGFTAKGGRATDTLKVDINYYSKVRYQDRGDGSSDMNKMEFINNYYNPLTALLANSIVMPNEKNQVSQLRLNLKANYPTIFPNQFLFLLHSMLDDKYDPIQYQFTTTAQRDKYKRDHPNEYKQYCDKFHSAAAYVLNNFVNTYLRPRSQLRKYSLSIGDVDKLFYPSKCFLPQIISKQEIKNNCTFSKLNSQIDTICIQAPTPNLARSYFSFVLNDNKTPKIDTRLHVRQVTSKKINNGSNSNNNNKQQ